MELDMQKKLKHVRLELSVDIEFLGILAWMFPLASPDSLLASCINLSLLPVPIM
jgi:hypothetical protein